MAQKQKVAVIGLGNIGTVVATNLVKGSRSVIVADRTIEKANELARKLGSLAQPRQIPAAIKEADILILAIWFDGIKEFLKSYATELQGKIIIDPSNPIAPEETGGFKKTIGENQSAGEVLLSYLPENAKLVKALGTLGVSSLASAAFQKPEAAVLFYATDEATIHTYIEELIRDNGFEPWFIGGIDQSIRIEVFGDLHEFGALGSVITLTQAEEKVEKQHV